jgi:hypothetical protein
MTGHRSSLLLLLLMIGFSAIHCTRKMQNLHPDKIQFDYSSLDENGLRNGEVAVDYEFCIPANEAQFQEVLSIDPGVRLMKSSKGRIGCTNQQWLCINSTHSLDWKDKLYAIASLSFVERIQQTFYE